MLDVALLGCGGGMPIPERYLSALLLKYRGRKVLVDCGEGTQVSMRLLGWGFKSIDVICITHGHGDHIIGLPGLLATIGNSGRTEPMTIIGPEGITGLVQGLRAAAPFLPYEVHVMENPKDKILLRDLPELEIRTLEVEHSTSCLAYSFYIKRKPKFDAGKAAANNIPKALWSTLQKGCPVELDGRSYTPDMVLGEERQGIKLSYVTDTRPMDQIPKFIMKSDLLICEGNYGDDQDLEKAISNQHMTFREAAQLAREGDVKKLLLTHFSPVMQQPELYIKNATEVYANTVIGSDRHTETLKFEDK